MEEWRDIRGYEGLYQVSNEGRVKSLGRGIVLKTGADGIGHLLVWLCKNGIKKAYRVHKLVAKHFVPNPNNYELIHHKNHDKTDNRVENLEWMTKKDHIIEHRAKTVHQYKDNELIAIYASASEAAEKLGCSIATIANHCRSNNEFNGFIFKYA